MCRVCEHRQRIDIESALLAGQPEERVAEFYKVKIGELAAHKKNCSPYLLSLGDLVPAADGAGDFGDEPDRAGGLQRSLNANEDWALASTQQQLIVAFKKATRQVSRAYDGLDDAERMKASKQVLTKAILDHHVGMASEIRQISKARAELDRQYNAAAVDGRVTGPQAIAEAIRGIG